MEQKKAWPFAERDSLNIDSKMVGFHSGGRTSRASHPWVLTPAGMLIAAAFLLSLFTKSCSVRSLSGLPNRNHANLPATLKIIPFVADVVVTKLKQGLANAQEEAAAKEASEKSPGKQPVAVSAATVFEVGNVIKHDFAKRDFSRAE